MRNIHIIIGRRSMSQDTEPVGIYCGTDGDAAIAAREEALASGQFEAVETVPYHVGVFRYADPEVLAAAAARKAEALKAQQAAGAEAAKKAADEAAAAEAAQKAADEAAAAEKPADEAEANSNRKRK